MKTIKAQDLEINAFAPYGTYTNLLQPEGFGLGDFYPDRLVAANGSGMPMAFSPLVVHNYNGAVVSQAEYHNLAGECILPLDDDILIHVAPPSGAPVPALTRVFVVPKGTLVFLNVGVWHLGPMAKTLDEAHVMIGLPQRTYKSDCYVVDYPADAHFTITL